MGYNLLPYDKLKLSVKQSIDSLVIHHGYDEKNLDISLNKLPEGRRIQSMFLLKIVMILDNSNKNEQDKSRLVTAAVYYVREQIAATYSYISPENSNLYNSLTTTLNLDKCNQPGQNEVIELYSCLKEFLLSNVYVKSDPRQGYVEDQLFSKKFIKGYSVEEDIKKLGKMTQKLNVKIIDEEAEKRDQQDGSKKSILSNSFMGLFGGSSNADKNSQENTLELHPKQLK